MAVLYVRATYAEEENLKMFFKTLFGWGQTGVQWTRGRWECTIPRALNPDEIINLQRAATFEHYQQL